MIVQVHGENADAIVLAQKLTIEAGITGPEGHSISRPAFIEVCVAPGCQAPQVLRLVV